MNRRQGWGLALTSAASLMVALDQLVVATALSTIRARPARLDRDAGMDGQRVYAELCGAAMTAAALGDRFGRRRMFVAGLALFDVASPRARWRRAWPGSSRRGPSRARGGRRHAARDGAVSVAFPPETRGWAHGVYSGVTGLAVVGGPDVGGSITENLAWHSIFWIDIPIGLLAFPPCRPHEESLRIPANPHRSPPPLWFPAPRSGWSGAWCAPTHGLGQHRDRRRRWRAASCF